MEITAYCPGPDEPGHSTTTLVKVRLPPFRVDQSDSLTSNSAGDSSLATCHFHQVRPTVCNDAITTLKHVSDEIRYCIHVFVLFV